MERALVIYESMFGNTRAIARAVEEGLSMRMRTDFREVSEAPTRIPEDVTLLVVGGPTHAFGLTRARTREDASRQASGPLVSPGIGLREWLGNLCDVRGISAATFDTRIFKPRVPGSAAKGGEKRLRRKGFRIIAPAESFWVTGTQGPLVEGEIERARDWASRLAGSRSSTGSGRSRS
jgi:flavodoxin